VRVAFVTDGVASAVSAAKKAAGDKNVSIIGGLEIARACLNARLVDELQLRVVSSFTGAGRRLFDGVDQLTPRPTSAELYSDRTDIRYALR
jgi:dihydrofolate reductase